MSNETLILKTAVATNSTVKLTDCPMSSGEILEMVCRLYANGLTSGNRCFKAIGNAVTYNTDAVTEGDIYCVSYRDGGFYVGLRTTEDYEPKEGDWCIQFVKAQCTYEYSKTKRNTVHKLISGTYLAFYDKYTNQIIGGNKAKNTYRSYYMSTITPDVEWISLHIDKANKKDLMYPIKSEVLNAKGYWGLAGNNTAEDHLIEDFNIDTTKLGPDFLEFKLISASDILAYNATGHMGWLILSDATLAFTKTGPYSSSRTAAYSENTVDVNAIYVLEVRINGQRAHITAAGLNYVYSEIGQKGNVPYELVDGLLIFNQTAKQYSDVNDYNVDNLLKGFYALTTLETTSNTDTVTVYKYEVYQDNRPVALNSLNTNGQDEG